MNPLTITVKVIPKSSQNAVVSEETNLFQEKTLKVKTTQPPEDGRANESVIEILADHFGVKKKCIEIISGHTSRTKIVKVSSIPSTF